MESFFKSFIAYFVVVDPIGVALVFSGLTAGRSSQYVRQMAIKASGLSAALVLAFGFWGVVLLGLLGIEMDSFRIAGGLLIFYAAFGMITRPDTPSGQEPDEVFEDISVFPLSIPLMAGPGCLTLTVLLFSRARDEGGQLWPLVLAIVTLFSLALVSLLFSKKLTQLVGRTINSVFKRLLGVLLASLAIQFIADGIKGLMG